VQEIVMTGLRTKWGVADSAIKTLAPNKSLSHFVDQTVLQDMEIAGLLEVTEDNIRCTPQGIAVLNAVIPRLLKSQH
jgi:coproporphyrinogen III oxidase-like Fe-S oxidoreductase